MKSRMMNAIRRIVSLVSSRVAARYIRKDRWFRYSDLRLRIFKGVFHPGLFRSSKVFAEWISGQPIAGKKLLEIGSGSGMISLVAAKKGAIVTAADINARAVENTKENAVINHLDITAIHSDLFDSVTTEIFDMVLVNPPYYPKQPANDYEKAWFCGEDFSYFRKLFSQLKQRTYKEKCIIILSDTCDLTSINNIADQSCTRLNEVFAKKVSGERLIIYEVQLMDPAGRKQ